MADSRVADLTAASALTGTELFYADDGVADVKVTANQIKTFTGVREALSGNRTYYVRADGSDSNTGLVDSSGGAFLTGQHAWDLICTTLDLNGYNVTIDLGDGSFAGIGDSPLDGEAQKYLGGGVVVITGNGTSTTIADISMLHNYVYVSDITVTLMLAAWNGNIDFGNNTYFGTSATEQIHASSGGQIRSIGGDYTISGDAPRHIWVSNGAQVRVENAVVTVTGRTFSDTFVRSEDDGNFDFGGTFTGTFTGSRFAGSGRFYGSGLLNDLTAIPGSVAGTLDAGGRYGDWQQVGPKLYVHGDDGKMAWGSGDLITDGFTGRAFDIHDTSYTGVSVQEFSNDTAFPYIRFNKSRGGLGAYTVVAADDILGGFFFGGADGTDWAQGGSLTFEVDGTPGAGDMPTRMVVSLSADGSESPTDRLVIDSVGTLFIGDYLDNLAPFGSYGRLEINCASTSGFGLTLASYLGAAEDDSKQIAFVKSRGTPGGALGAVVANDRIGALEGWVDDGVSVENLSATIQYFVEGITGSHAVTGRIEFGVSNNAQFPDTRAIIYYSNFTPGSNDTIALGRSDLGWSDLFLAAGGLIDFGNNDIRIDSGSDALTFSGAGNGYYFTASVKPANDNVGALGASGGAWEDLFLSSGGVINWDAADVTLTHSANTLTLAGGKLVVPEIGIQAGAGVTGTGAGFDPTNTQLQISNASGYWNLGLTRGETNGNSPVIYSVKTRHATDPNSHTALIANDEMFAVITGGSDGTDFIMNGAITAMVDGAVSTGVVPMSWTFWTGSTQYGYNLALTLNSSQDVIVGSSSFVVGSSRPFSDSAGILTLQNIDALDATTESTVEAAIDTLANLTSIQGRTVTLADAGFDVLFGWDDSGSAYKDFALSDITTEAAPAAGDYVLIYGAEGDLRKVNWSGLPGAGGGIGNVVEDTTPELGGVLETNNFDIQVEKYSADSAGGEVTFQKSRHASVGSHTVVQGFDALGVLSFYGSDGSAFQLSSSIVALAFDTIASGIVPGLLTLNVADQAGAIQTPVAIISDSMSVAGSVVATNTAAFWVYWTADSTTILASYNMTSIADTTIGDADGTIASDFASANWAGFVTTNDATGGWDATFTQSSGFNARAAGTFGVLCAQMQDGGTAAAAFVDPEQWQVVGFGALA